MPLAIVVASSESRLSGHEWINQSLTDIYDIL